MEYNYILQQFPGWCYNDFGQVDFADFYLVRIPDNPTYTIDYLGEKMFSYNPPGFDRLVKIRDFLIKPFGLKTSKDVLVNNAKKYSKGSVMVFFRVVERNDNTIVLEEKDKHLDFRILMEVKKAEEPTELVFKFSTIVKYNNRLGKIYFAIVKPFHKLLIDYSVKKLRKNLFDKPNQLN